MNGNTNAATVKHLQQQPTWWDGVHPQQMHRSDQYSQHVERNIFSPWCLWSHRVRVYIPPEQKWDQKTGLRSVEGHWGGWGWSTCPVEARLRELGSLSLEGRWQPGKQQPGKASGGLQRRWAQTLFRGAQWRDERKQTQDSSRETLTGWKENNLIVSVVKQWKRLSRKNVWSP